jgi:alpha-1,6-mannosyltransferase
LDAYIQPWNGLKASKIYRLSLYLLTFSGVVFRSELAILVATITFYLFASRRISIKSVIIPAGLGGLTVGLLCTVPIDSYFWQTFPLWPEWTGFYYNTILGRSADWGVSPWYFYFVNALPRLLMNPLTYLLCIPVALLNASSRKPSLDILIPSLTFVGLYSMLPHKEWRFIIYIIPGLIAVAAAGASWVWTRRGKSIVYAVLSFALVGSISVSFIAATSLLAVSSLNYPGGEAIDALHNKLYHRQGQHVRVYFDNLACQSGVTRFLENHHGSQTVLDVLETQELANRRTWEYSKTEDPELLLNPEFWYQFHYVIAERPEKVIGKWDVVHVVYGYSGIRILKPGEKVGEVSEPLDVVGLEGAIEGEFASKVANVWRKLEELMRNRVLQGWWIEIKMEPKLKILSNGLHL